MTARVQAEVGIDDSEFSAFYTKFLQFKAGLEDTPEAWQKVAASAEVSRRRFEEMRDDSIEQAKANTDAVQQVGLLQRGIEAAGRGLVRMDRAASSLQKNISETTVSLLKWTGIVGVLGGVMGGAGSLLAVDKFAARVSSQRTEAMGVGSTPGRQRAADVAYSRFVGTGFSSRVADMQHDSSQLAALQRLLPGMSANDIANADPNDLIGPLLEGSRRLARSTPRGQLFNNPALSNLYTHEQINTLASGDIQDSEIGEARNRYSRDRESFEYSGAKQWQDFERTIEESKSKIHNAFVSRLSALAEPLGKMTQSVEGVATKLLGSKLLDDVLDKLADGIDWLGKYVGSPEFETDITSFLSAIKKFAKTVVDLAASASKFVDWLVGPEEAQASTGPGGGGGGLGGPGSPPGGGGGRLGGGGGGGPGPQAPVRANAGERGWWTPERQQHAYEVLRAGFAARGAKDPDVAARAALSRWRNVEARGGPGSANSVAGGHFGFAQWSASRARNLGIQGDTDPDHQYNAYLHELDTAPSERAAAHALLNATTPEEGAHAMSMSERAGGYNPRTGYDNYYNQTLAGMGGLRVSAPTARVTVSHAAGTNPGVAAGQVGGTAGQ